MKKLFVVVFLSLILGVVVFYAFMGRDTSDMQFELIREQVTPMYGAYYQGSYKSAELQELFEKSKQLAKKYNGSLAVINLGSDDMAETVFHWVGFVLPGSDSLIEEPGYQPIKWEDSIYVKTSFAGHNSLMPTAAEVKRGAVAFAGEKGLVLKGMSLEIYKSETEMEILFPAKAALEPSN